MKTHLPLMMSSPALVIPPSHAAIAPPSGFGAGIPGRKVSGWHTLALSKLSPPWFYSWRYELLGKYANYVPMVWRCNTDWVTKAIPVAKLQPSQLYFLGNEPEFGEQSNTTPKDFITGVRLWKEKMGGTIALPGIFWGYHGQEWGKGGREWLEQYIRLGGPLPNMWHFHLYVHSGKQMHKEIENIQRQYGGRPVIVSECAGAVPSADAEVMDAARLACQRGDVQAAAWFSAYYDEWEEPSLLTPDGNLTALGKRYVAG